MAETGLTDEKRRLIEESERYRHSMTAEFRNLKAATAWVPRTLGVVRAVSPLLALSAPVLGLFLRKRKKSAPRHHDPEGHDGKAQGLVAKAFLAFELLRKARPFWESFQRSRHRSNNKAREAPKTHRARSD
jgi:hypothetical protein